MERHGIRGLALLVLGLALGCLGSAPARAQSAVLVQTGDSVPGAPLGEFRFISMGLPPALNDAGEVAFHAGFSDPTSVVAGDGIWAGEPGNLRKIALRLDRAPDLPAGLALISFNRNPGLDAAGRVGFSSRILSLDPTIDPPLTPLNDSGIWVGRDPGSLRLVAREGDQVPGLPAGVSFGLMGPLQMNQAGQIFFNNRLVGVDETAGIDSTNDFAFFTGGPGTMQILAREGDPVPGLPGVPFGELAHHNIMNNAGQVGFVAILAGAGVDETNRFAMFLGVPGDLQLVLRTGDQASGLPAGVIFPSDEFVLPFRLNDAGALLLRTDLAGGDVDGTNDRALYLYTSGSLQLILRKGDPVPGFPGGTVAGVGIGPINEGGEILNGTTTSSGVNVILQGPPGALQAIAAADPFGLFRTLGGIGLNGPGEVLLGGSYFDGVRTVNALWAGPPDAFGIAVQVGDQPPFARQKITRIGRATLNDAGQVAYTATNSTFQLIGIARPQIVPDTDGDGIEDPIDGQFGGVFTDQSGQISNSFTDQHLGGISFGTITDRADLTFTVRNLADPSQGMYVAAGGGGIGTGAVEACIDLTTGLPVTILLTDGNVALVECGSLLVRMLSGPGQIQMGDILVTISTGAKVKITDLGGRFEIRNAGIFGSIEVADAGVTTSLGVGETATVDATGGPANQPPVAEAGPDQTVEATSATGASVILDGGASSDPDAGDSLSFEWSGPFGTVAGVSPNVDLPPGTHAIALTVTDERAGRPPSGERSSKLSRRKTKNETSYRASGSYLTNRRQPRSSYVRMPRNK